MTNSEFFKEKSKDEKIQMLKDSSKLKTRKIKKSNKDRLVNACNKHPELLNDEFIALRYFEE
jgi:hypothetical protein